MLHESIMHHRFVASLTKIRLNSIKNLHFTGMEPYGNYITT